jgi:hypothetical protein
MSKCRQRLRREEINARHDQRAYRQVMWLYRSELLVCDTTRIHVIDAILMLRIECRLECGASLLRKDMATHQKDECPRRLTACEQCGEMINMHLLAVSRTCTDVAEWC